MDKRIFDIVTAFADKARQLLPVNMVLLYGSHSNGTARKWSDIDVAIISDDIDGDIIQQEYELFRLRRDIDVRIEPVLFKGFKDRSGFLDGIIKNGTVIYQKD